MFKYIDGCSDCRYLYASLTAEQLTIIENILTAYNSGKIAFIIPHYENGEPDYYGDFFVVSNDDNYKMNGFEVLILKWYEGIEDTVYMVDCFQEVTSI